MCPEVSTVIVGLIAQHMPARADRCPGWFDGRIEGCRVSGAPGGKLSEASGAGPDGKASKAAKVSGAVPDGQLSEAAEVGVPLTSMSNLLSGEAISTASCQRFRRCGLD